MARSLILSCLMVLASTGDLTAAQPNDFGPVWKSGLATVFVVPCAPASDSDKYCRAIEVRRAGNVHRLGEDYASVALLWSRKQGQPGPDLLLRAVYGGSAGMIDLFAVSFSNGFQTRKLTLDHADQLTTRSRTGPLRLDAPFTVQFFNGAPNAGFTAISLPIGWVNGDFAVDLAALTGQTFTQNDLRFRELAMFYELNDWRTDSSAAKRLFPPMANSGTPVTVRALVELMLAGHADRARAMLHRAWPDNMDGDSAFWAALCKKVVEDDRWKRFRLARVPHARLIEAGAAGAS